MGEVTPINRIVLPGQSHEGPAIPESFRESLRQYDPNLIVAWNTIKKRFVIEQCVEHLAEGTAHTHICRRNYVAIAQDDEGHMLPLGDKVMEMIKARDVLNAGYGPDDLQKFLADQKAAGVAERERISKAQDDAIKHGSRFNRRQLLKAVSLMQNHSLEVNQ